MRSDATEVSAMPSDNETETRRHFESGRQMPSGYTVVQAPSWTFLAVVLVVIALALAVQPELFAAYEFWVSLLITAAVASELAQLLGRRASRTRLQKEAAQARDQKEQHIASQISRAKVLGKFDRFGQ